MREQAVLEGPKIEPRPSVLEADGSEAGLQESRAKTQHKHKVLGRLARRPLVLKKPVGRLARRPKTLCLC